MHKIKIERSKVPNISISEHENRNLIAAILWQANYCQLSNSVYKFGITKNWLYHAGVQSPLQR